MQELAQAIVVEGRSEEGLTTAWVTISNIC